MFFCDLKFVSISVKTTLIFFRKIRNALRVSPYTDAWIGLTYSVERGFWMWIQGHGLNYASADSIAWHITFPDPNAKLNACVFLSLYYEPLAANDRCNRNKQALCEVAM